MKHVRYRNGELWCEGTPLRQIAARVDTPAYVYSRAVLTDSYRKLSEHFQGVPHTICYSVKANSNLEILRILARLGAGFDIVSGGELLRVLRAGGDPHKIVFSGVGKTVEEIHLATRRGVGLINLESPAELERIVECARQLGRRARVAVRVNPDVDPRTHRHIATGRQTHKFGVHWPEVLPLCRRAAALPSIDFVGIGAHIGSQITGLAPFAQTADRLEKLARELIREGIPVRHLDFGGGIGIRYQNERAVSLVAYSRMLKRLVRRLGCQLLLEPGRLLVGPAGVLLTSVVLEKSTSGRRFVVVDAAMNDFIRPALYGAKHRILAVVRRGSRQASPADVVGPVCETADCFARAIPLPALAPGSLLALMDVGAYGFVLASNYNTRPRPPEVLVSGKRFRVIRRREAWRDLVRPES